jgi:hypothetical protein
MTRVMSVFTRTPVDIDVWAEDALAQDAQAAMPETYRLALAESGPPPKMFSDGLEPLPPFTASGFDPQLLTKLPYTMRHYVAAATDTAAAHGLFEQYSDDPMARFDHEGFSNAVERMRQWLAGKWESERNPAPPTGPEAEQERADAEAGLYDALFAHDEAVRQDRISALNERFTAFEQARRR